MATAIGVAAYALTFTLVFGLSASVDVRSFRSKFRQFSGIAVGLFCQFVLLPLFGLATVRLFLDAIPEHVGITLLVVTSSPGGSYSNWWCSLFNADLALSVAMTTASTVLSAVMLPLNLLLYIPLAFEGRGDVHKHLRWSALFVAIGVVASAILLGLLTSARYCDGDAARHGRFAKLGNAGGVVLIAFSILMNFVGGGGDDACGGGGGGGGGGDRAAPALGLNASRADAPRPACAEPTNVLEQDAAFYAACTLPCALGLAAALALTSAPALGLRRPERVATAVECAYQNVGIATTVVLNMFEGREQAQALGVPVFYGAVEIVLIGGSCVLAWRAGWTYAPARDPLHRVLFTSYQPTGAKAAPGAVAPLAADAAPAEVELARAGSPVNPPVDGDRKEDLDAIPGPPAPKS